MAYTLFARTTHGLYHFQFSHVRRANEGLPRACMRERALRFRVLTIGRTITMGANFIECRTIDEVYRSPGATRALVLGMRVRTKPFPSIKGPCFHPARSGDRPFDLVSNAGAMTLPHFAVQTAIHSTLPPSDAWCALPERCTVEVSCAICSRCNDRSRVSSARIGLNRFKDRDRA